MRIKRLRPGQVGDYWPSKKPGRQSDSDPWCLTWYDCDARQTRRESLGTSDFSEACLKVAEEALRRAKPNNAPPEEVMISTCLVHYWERHAQNTPSSSTTKYNLRLWTEFWGDKTVEEITPETQEEFRASVGQGRLSPSSIDKILATGKAALRFAVEKKLLKSVPKIIMVEKAEEKRARNPMGKPITPSMAARLIDAVESRHLLFFILILGNTLARNEAVFDAQRKQFDEEEDTLNLNPAGRRQNKKYRPTVPVTPTLRPWLLSVTDPEAYFVSEKEKKMTSLQDAWERAAHKAGLPKGITPYSFRHGIAREMRRRGVPQEQISFMLGHLPMGSAKTTWVYAPMEPRDCKDAVAAIEEVMAEIRSRLKVVSIDDPNAPLPEKQIPQGMRLGRLGEQGRRNLIELIRSGTGVMEICRQIGCTTTLVYKYRRRFLGYTNIRRLRARGVPPSKTRDRKRLT